MKNPIKILHIFPTFFFATFLTAGDTKPYDCDEEMFVEYETKNGLGKIEYNSPITLEQIAYEVLDEVLSFGLRTANSVAATEQDVQSLRKMRDKIGAVEYQKDGYFFFHIDDLFNAAQLSIEMGIANCDEYSSIALIVLKKYQHHYPDLFEFHLLEGLTFDHLFVVLTRPSEDIPNGLVLDPWLRKIIPFSVISQFFAEALIRVPEDQDYVSRKVYLLGDYDPHFHNFENVSYSDNRDYPQHNRKKLTRLKNNNGYLVPYDSHLISFDPEIHNVIESENKKYAIARETPQWDLDFDDETSSGTSTDENSSSDELTLFDQQRMQEMMGFFNSAEEVFTVPINRTARTPIREQTLEEMIDGFFKSDEEVAAFERVQYH